MSALAWHRAAFVSAASLACAVFLFGEAPAETAQVVVLAVMVALLGLPHGALDPAIARLGLGLSGALPLLGFTLGYSLLAALVIALWIAAPLPSLAVFLALSAWHFSDDWRGEAPIATRLLVGGTIILLPALLHADEVSRIFGVLTDAHAGAVLAEHLRAIAPASLVAALLACLLLARRAPGAAVEALTVVAGAIVLPPILFFVLYFCGLHSPRHLLTTASDLGLTGPRSIVSAALPATLATLAAAAVVSWLIQTPEMTSGLLRIVFIGLAALTVPHMLLTKLWATAARA